MNISKKSSVLCLIILIFLWEFSCKFSNIHSLIPSFSQVVIELWAEICNFKLIKATCISLSSVLIGYMISILLSLLVSVVCMNSNLATVLFSTLYKILNPLPSVAILPIILLLTGLSYSSISLKLHISAQSSIIILIFHSVFWPMLASNIMGFNSIPTVFEDFARNIEISTLKKYILIYIPSASSHIITGLRTSWGRSWRSLISAEAIFGISGSTQGLGYYIYYHRAFANMTNIFAGIIIISIISLFAETIFSFIEKNTIQKWGISK
mgnify:CR=1 FL=1